MTFCVFEFSYFGFCKVPCREGLRSIVVYFGAFGWWGETWGRACAGQTFLVTAVLIHTAPLKHANSHKLEITSKRGC